MDACGAPLSRPPTFSGVRASQQTDELAAFVMLLLDEGVTRYGEIGARGGDTFHAVMSRLPPKSKGVALDLPGGKWGKSSSKTMLERAVKDLRGKNYDASCIFGDSTTPATIAQFKGRGPYDAIFIDGDHTLAGVTADWQNYRGIARIVGFHDIYGMGQHNGDARVEVPLLWKSICASHDKRAEFYVPGSKMGIGVVWMD